MAHPASVICFIVPKFRYYLSYVSYLSDYLRLSNFLVLMGTNDDWRENDFCYYQLPPVPQGATVEYHCERLVLGHLVSINKTRIPEWPKQFRMLMLHEVQVFGYRAGKSMIF